MAQQVFDQYAPLAKVSANETIPVVAAIAQTRDGKDELLHGTVPFVPSGGLYVPVSAANRLPVETTLTDSNELKKASLGAVIRHRWISIARGVNRDFASSGTLPLNPGESVTVVEVAGPGRLIMGRFLTTKLMYDADFRVELDGIPVSGSAAQFLTGFFSLMHETRLNLSAGRTHGPWEVLTNQTNRYALGLDGSKIGPWNMGFKVELLNTSGSEEIPMACLLWYAVMSSTSIVMEGAGEAVPAQDVRDALATGGSLLDDYTVITYPNSDEGDGWKCEVFWRNGVDEQEIRALLAQEFGLV